MAGVAVATVTIVVALVALGAWLTHRRTTMAFAPRDWILIADLENLTGQPGIEAAVRAQLERELTVSRVVNVVPAGRVSDTLALMRLPSDTRVTEAAGREICLRDGGIRAMLTGSIQRVGGAYTVLLKLVDPTTGASVAAFDGRAENERGVLGAVRRLAEDVRRTLGEPLAAIPPPAAAPERVTTPSLEAATLYSKGVALMDQFEWERAETFFDQAIALDPEFALGHFFRGVSRTMTSRESTRDFEVAASLAGTVTLRERFMIQAMAASMAGEQVRAAELFELLLEQYPDDYWGHELVSWIYFKAEDDRRWGEHQAACRRLRPNFPQPRFHAGWVFLLTEGDAEKAQAEFARVLERRPGFSSVSVQCGKAFVYWMRGQMEEAAAEFAEFRARRMGYLAADSQLSARRPLALFYAFRGMTNEALALLETNRDMTFPPPDAAVARRFRFARALIYQQMGRDREFVRLMKEAIGESSGMTRMETLGWLAIAMARQGQKEEARRLERMLMEESGEPPVDFWHPRLPAQVERARRAFGLQIAGEILLAEKHAPAAIARFEQVLEMVPPRNVLFATTLSPRVWLAAARAKATAHEQCGEWNAAVAAWRTILDHKALCVGTDGAPAIWREALAAIPRALEEAGQLADAAQYREDLRRLGPPPHELDGTTPPVPDTN